MSKFDREFDRFSCSANNPLCEKLPGAIPADTNFLTIYGSDEGICSFQEVANVTPEEFEVDKNNNFFIGEAGVVADAFSFASMTKQDEQEAMQEIIADYRSKYPGYDFALLSGRFPIGYDGDKHRAIMSTHVLYIRNWEKMLVKADVNGIQY